MPFKSQAQRGYLYVHRPEVAKEFEAATPKGAKLPYHVGGKKKKRKRMKESDFMAAVQRQA